jgi:hypothetical protein
MAQAPSLPKVTSKGEKQVSKKVETPEAPDTVNVLEVLHERETQLQADGRREFRKLVAKGSALTKADVTRAAELLERDNEIGSAAVLPVLLMVVSETDRLEKTIADAAPAMGKLQEAKGKLTDFATKRKRQQAELDAEEAALTTAMHAAGRSVPDTAAMQCHLDGLRRRWSILFSDDAKFQPLVGEWHNDVPPSVRGAIMALPANVLARLSALGKHKPEPEAPPPPRHRPATMELESSMSK